MSGVAWAILGAIAGGAGTAAMLPGARSVGRRRGWADPPNEARKMHREPVPVTGGWAVLGGVAAAMLAVPAVFTVPLPVWLGAAGIFGLGWAEDLGRNERWTIPAPVRLLLQILIVGAVFAPSPGAGVLGEDPVAWLAVVWIVVVMNATNFIDGLDRLAVGVAGIAAAGMAIVGALSGGGQTAAALAGCLLAYVALTDSDGRRLFLGDSGSLMVGYLVGALACLQAVAVGPNVRGSAAFLMCGVLVLEAVVTVARRWWAGQRVWEADADHLHHRLSRVEGSEAAVRRIYWFGVFFACLGIATALLPPSWGLLALAVGVAVGTGIARELYTA